MTNFGQFFELKQLKKEIVISGFEVFQSRIHMLFTLNYIF